MDSDAEDTEAVAMFFTYVNRAMQFISGDEFATFNPIGFCCDGNGANFAGLAWCGAGTACSSTFDFGVFANFLRMKSLCRGTHYGNCSRWKLALNLSTPRVSADCFAGSTGCHMVWNSSLLLLEKSTGKSIPFIATLPVMYVRTARRRFVAATLV